MTVEKLGQHDGPAIARDESFSIDSFAAPVFTFDQDVGLDRAYDVFGVRFVKYYNVVDGFESGKNPGPVRGGIDGSLRALELAHTTVAVESYYQHVSLSA